MILDDIIGFRYWLNNIARPTKQSTIEMWRRLKVGLSEADDLPSSNVGRCNEDADDIKIWLRKNMPDLVMRHAVSNLHPDAYALVMNWCAWRRRRDKRYGRQDLSDNA